MPHQWLLFVKPLSSLSLTDRLYADSRTWQCDVEEEWRDGITCLFIISATEGDGGYAFTPFCLFVCVCLLARSEGLPLLLPAFVCLSVCLCVCLCVVHPPSSQVLQPILIKLGQMDHWGT